MVKEKSGWKVFMNWENSGEITQLMDEAEKLKKAKKYEGAAEKYQQVLELDSKMVEAKEALEDTQNEISSFGEKQAYIDNIELYDLTAKYHNTYLDGKVPGVDFKLKNKGNRTLSRVEVTVYFKNAEGMVIVEETYNPVLVSSYTFSGDNKPLKPNYIWQQERGKFYKADKVPSEWKTGAVSAKITDIEFDETALEEAAEKPMSAEEFLNKAKPKPPAAENTEH